MCVLLSIYNKKRGDPEITEAILSNVFDFRAYNPDGVGIVAFGRGKKPFYSRKLNPKIAKFGNVIDNYDTIHIHFRQRTSGGVNQTNIHYWKYKDWYFAHNGVVQNHDTFKDMPTCDSLRFFEDLIGKRVLHNDGTINYDKLQKLIDKSGLWGRFVLINNKTKLVYYVGDFHIYNLNSKALIVSSTSLDFTTFKIFYGIGFQRGCGLSIYHKKIEGLFTIDPIKEDFKLIKKSEQGFLYDPKENTEQGWPDKSIGVEKFDNLEDLTKSMERGYD